MIKNKIFKILAIVAIASLHALGARPVMLHEKQNLQASNTNALSNMQLVKTWHYTYSMNRALIRENGINLDRLTGGDVSTTRIYAPIDAAQANGQYAGNAEYFLGTFSRANISALISISEIGILNDNQDNYYQGYNIAQIEVVPYFKHLETGKIFSSGQGQFLVEPDELTGGITTGYSGSFNHAGVGQALYAYGNGATSAQWLCSQYQEETLQSYNDIILGFYLDMYFSSDNPVDTYIGCVVSVDFYAPLTSNTIYQSGYDAGYTNGDISGYNRGVAEGNTTIKTTTEYLSAITNTIQPILDIRILPGITVGTVLLIPLVLGLFLLILHFIKN